MSGSIQLSCHTRITIVVHVSTLDRRQSWAWRRRRRRRRRRRIEQKRVAENSLNVTEHSLSLPPPSFAALFHLNAHSAAISATYFCLSFTSAPYHDEAVCVCGNNGHSRCTWNMCSSVCRVSVQISIPRCANCAEGVRLFSAGLPVIIVHVLECELAV